MNCNGTLTEEFDMATSDKEQQSELVPQHKRLAQGAPVNGAQAKTKQPSQGGLSQAKKRK
jgi:hypothetical protein